MKGSYICTKCAKSLASSQSLWNHKQRCKDTGERKRSWNTDGLSEKHDDPTFINSTYSRTYNVPTPTTQPPPTFNAAAAAAAGEESSVKRRLTNPKIQALLNEIINDNDLDRNVTSQVIHKGFSIASAPPPATTTTSSLSSKSSKPSAKKSQQQQHSTLTMGKEPVVKKIKLSSSKSKDDIRNLPQSKHIEYSDTDSDAESPVDDSDDNDDDMKMHHPRTKGQIIGYEGDDQEQHIEKQLAPPDDDEELEDRFNHLLIEYTR